LISYSEYLPQSRKARQEKTHYQFDPFGLAQDMLGVIIVFFLGDLARRPVASQTLSTVGIQNVGGELWFKRFKLFKPFETFGTI